VLEQEHRQLGAAADVRHLRRSRELIMRNLFVTAVFALVALSACGLDMRGVPGRVTEQGATTPADHADAAMNDAGATVDAIAPPAPAPGDAATGDAACTTCSASCPEACAPCAKVDECGSKQVCVGGVCLSCGEPGTDGAACKDDKTCAASSGTCTD
jgi:hypothetical protein